MILLHKAFEYTQAHRYILSESSAVGLILAEWSVYTTLCGGGAGTHFGRARFIGARIWSSVSWFQWQSVEVRLDQHHRDSGGHPPGSYPSWRGWVYRLAPEEPLFRGMPTGPEAFLEPLCVSGQRLCARTHLKRPCATLARLVGRVTNTDIR